MPAEPFLAEISIFAGNFAPRGYAFCAGQILPIAQNTALFSLLGTTYGGNGQTTFALPDLRGRVPLGVGQGPGLPVYDLGEVSGSPNVTLLITQMPSHSHGLQGTATVTHPSSSAAGDNDSPNGRIPAVSPGGDEQWTSAASANGTTAAGTVNLGAVTTTLAGGGQPHDNMQPYLGLNFVIALEGIFPSRN